MSLDPLQVLGLGPGASAAEIKRAYRALAKANHPDSAGERALPRFLEIQAAYETLMTGRARPPGVGPARRSQADPARARATREAWRGRARGTGTGGGPAGGASTGRGSAGANGTAGRASREQGPAGGPDPAGGAGAAGTRGRRASKKATLGSTSYDGAAAEPFEPSWSGGSWYGQSSGTYWTINPREYADPRKHGPEYLARAKRPLGGGGETGEADQATGRGAADRPGFSPSDARGVAGEPTADATEPGPPTAAGSAAHATADGEPGSPGKPAGAGKSRDGGSIEALLAATVSGPRTPAARLVLALVGWPPLGFVIAGVAGEASGCARFAATCQLDLAPILWLVQIAILVGLVAVPGVAGVAAVGTVAALAAALPAAAVLALLGGGGNPAVAADVLAVLLAAAYLGGVALGIRRRAVRCNA